MSYVDFTQFMFFSRSADKVPGRGVHEHLSKRDCLDDAFRKLAKVKDWRKKLSNFYISSFKLDGFTWNSVEHFYQASKFKKNNFEFYKQFTVESESLISTDARIAKAAGGKTGRYRDRVMRPSKITMDPDFFDNDHHRNVMRRAMEAKFEQCPECLKALLLTRDARLMHKTRGTPLQRVFTLEEIREKHRAKLL